MRIAWLRMRWWLWNVLVDVPWIPSCCLDFLCPTDSELDELDAIDEVSRGR